MIDTLIKEVSSCTLCKDHLPHGCRPVISVSSFSRILIIGQAPGRMVHRSGIPWDDKSGDNLRTWMGVNINQFYNADLFGIVPMGFCYPGTGKSGDLPPRPECAPRWHDSLLKEMPNIQLTLLIGNYAQKYYLGKNYQKNLTQTVRNFKSYLPTFLPLPHPSPRNNIWMKKNPWFKAEILPILHSLISVHIKMK